MACFCMAFFKELLLSSAETFAAVLAFQVDKRQEKGDFISHAGNKPYFNVN